MSSPDNIDGSDMIQIWQEVDSILGEGQTSPIIATFNDIETVTQRLTPEQIYWRRTGIFDEEAPDYEAKTAAAASLKVWGKEYVRPILEHNKHPSLDHLRDFYILHILLPFYNQPRIHLRSELNIPSPRNILGAAKRKYAYFEALARTSTFSDETELLIRDLRETIIFLTDFLCLAPSRDRKSTRLNSSH